MAKETTLEPLFLNTARNYPHHIQNDAETAAVDITGWALSFMIKRRVDDTTALVTKTTANGGIVIAGTYASDPDDNAQRATVSILDTDTVSLDPTIAHWELKRTDNNVETILGYGQVELKRALHRT